MNENKQMPNKSIANNKWRCHHPTSIDGHIGTVYVCFQNKNYVTMHSFLQE